MSSLDSPDRAIATIEAAPAIAAGAGQRWQIAVAPGALLLAALSLTPVGSRVGFAAIETLAALRPAGERAAFEVALADAQRMPAPLGFDSFDSDLGIADARAFDLETQLAATLAQAPAAAAVVLGGPSGAISLPVGGGGGDGGGGGIEPPGGDDAQPPSMTDLPNIPDLLDPNGDLGVPTVEDVAGIAELLVSDLPDPVSGVVDGVEIVVAQLPVQNTLAAVSKPVSDVVALVPDAGDLAEDVVGDLLGEPALGDTVSGLGDGLGDLGDGVGDTLGGVSDTLGDVGDGLGDVLGGVGDGLGDALDDTLGDGLGDVLGGVGDGLGDTLGDTLGDGLGDTLGDGVGGVGEGVGGVIGGLGGLL